MKLAVHVTVIVEVEAGHFLLVVVVVFVVARSLAFAAGHVFFFAERKDKLM